MDTTTWEGKIYIIAVILVIIGAITWGCIGLFSRNPIGWLNDITFKNVLFERIIYTLVGIAGIWLAFNISKMY